MRDYSRSARRRFGRFVLETLEQKTLLAADVVISEFMASNEETLLDEDQEASDWIEIHNRSDQTVDLNGWFLTDNQRELTKWSFPNVTLQPDEYKLIFASDKDRTAVGGNLHTNFKLNREGDYLALVRPNGVTIEDAIDPEFPEQAEDISYGRGAASVSTLVNADSLYQYTVPSNDGFDELIDESPEWTRTEFDATAWSGGQAGFGFETETADGVVVTPFSVKLDGADSTLGGSLTHLINQQSPFLSPIPITAGTVHSAHSENDGTWLSSTPATLDFDLVFPTRLDHLLLWNYSFLDPLDGLEKQHGLGTNEFAVSFSMDGNSYSDEQFYSTAPAVEGQAVPLEQFHVGDQMARFVRLRQISSHAGGLYGLGEIRFARGRMIDPELLYDEDLVATDLKAAMYDAGRTSAYLRSTFDVDAPLSVSELKLQLQFDDGFVAYLNGIEVARANAPANLGWDAAATSTRPDQQAVEFLEIDISDHRDILQATENVLAIQLLNSASDTMDLLLHPRLEMVGADALPFGFLESPTPGQPNSARAGAAVQFSRAGGILAGETTVELSVDNSLDVIRFTTDGSPPEASSTRYTGPIVVTGTTEIQARSFTPAGTPGLVRREAFLKLASDLEQFDSNLPIFVIESFGERITSSANLRSTYSVVFDLDTNTGRAAVADEPHYVGRSGLRQRGRSSAGFAQKQYKYELWDQQGNDAGQELLGLPEEADWVLNGPYTDKSLMRNAVTYQWWRELGYDSPRTRFVEVFLNEDGDEEISYGDDYVGLYVLIESIERGEDRIDIQGPENTTDVDQITGGYVIEAGNPGQFTTSVSGRNIGYQYEDPGPRDLNSAQKQWIKGFIEEFETALYSPNFTHPQTGKHYTDYIDVQSFVDYRIMREFTRDFDGGSTYFSVDRGGKLTMGPMWDMNWALGNVNYAEPQSVNRCGCDIEGWNYSYTTPTIGSWPAWSVRLQEDPEHWQLIVDRWHDLRDSVLKDENFLADIETNFRLLNAEAAQRNFEKWRTLGRNTVISPPGFQQRDTYEKEVDYLRDWLVQHAAWLDAQFVPAPRLSDPGGVVGVGFQLQLESDLAPPGQKLIKQSDVARVHFARDDSLGTTWTELDFPLAAAWLDGSTGIGFDNSEGYASIIGRDVRTAMGANRSALIRLEFSFDDDPSSLRALMLNMRYDDGFVAYLNGTEIARSDSVMNATPGSARARTHEAYDFEGFDVTEFRQLLRRGDNVLAIHGINASSASTDFLIIPELVALSNQESPRNLPIYFTTDGTDPRLPGGEISPAAQLYSNPILIDRETTIRARTLQASTWSALAKAEFLVEVVAASSANLRISEVHYNPADADIAMGELDVDNDEFEFIEVLNISEQGVNLEDVRFTEVEVNGVSEGVAFTFPRQSLGPGDRIVIVENQAAFVSRYGEGVRVAGQYSGRLADGGERITLVAADGRIIQEFSYDNVGTWPETPDGLGASLQVVDLNGDYNSSGNWRGSGMAHGTPGRGKFKAGDSNLDGVFDSGDLVQIFQAGKYENNLANDADWASGDWTGNREFDSGDLVFAFQHGDYAAAALSTLGPSLGDIASAMMGETKDKRSIHFGD